MANLTYRQAIQQAPTGTTTKNASLTSQEIDGNFKSLNDELITKAPLESPGFSGVPTAPTATAGTNTTQLATTAFVQTGLSTRQPLDAELTAISGLSANGLIARTGASTAASRSIAVSGTGLSVTNADGVAGNPTVTSNATAANNVSTIVARDASGNFSAGTITAALAGNANTATKLATARTISLTGDVSGSVSFDGSANASITATVGDDSHNHIIANVDGLQTALDGKVAKDSSTGSAALPAGTTAQRSDAPAAGALRFNSTLKQFEGYDGTAWGAVSNPDATAANTASTIVARDASGNFSAGTITAALAGNALTASELQTARTILLTGDVTGSTSFNGSQDVTLTATIAANSVVLGTDTTGNYVAGATAGNYILVSGTAGEGWSPTIAVDATSLNTASKVVARDASGNFSAGTITAALAGNASTATTLQTARTINGTSFNGSANITTANWGTSRTLTIGNSGKAVSGSGNVTWSLTEIGAIPAAEKGVANGVATLDSSGLVPASQLPSYVDDVLEYAALASFPVTGELAKIYVALDTNKIYRWSGSAYIEISPVAGNADTATKLATARTILLTGDVTGSTSFNGSQDVTLTATIAANSVTLGTDTTGNYVAGLTQGTGIAVTGTVGEGWLPTVSLATVGTAGTYTKVTTDAYGRVASGTTLSATDIPALDASKITTGTLANDRLAGTYSGFTHKIGGENTVFTTPSSGTTSTAGRTVYGLAEYKSTSTSQVGAIVFIAPNTSSTIMHQMEVTALLHNQSIVSTQVQGYRTTGSWSSTRKVSTGTADIQVRWGVTPDGKNCLILGDVGTSWPYPHVSITKAMFSHTGVTDAYCTGWTVAVVTDLSAYTQVTSAIADSAITGSVTGNASTATKLATARTISLTGDVTGSVSFDGDANVSMTTTVAANSVVLGTDTTGNYVAGATAGNYILVSGTAGEGWSPTIAVDATSANTASKVVARDASGNFSAGTITAALAGNAATATKLATARTISLTGDVTGSVSFDGDDDVILETAVANNSHSHLFSDITITPTTIQGYGIAPESMSSGVDLNTKTSTGWFSQGSNVNATLLLNYPVTQAGLLEVFAYGGSMIHQRYWVYNSDDVYYRAKYSTGAWTAWVKSANVNDNVATATKLATARTISLTGDVTGSVSFDGDANVSMTTVVGDDSHNHIIANVDGLQTALDGKVDKDSNTGSAALPAGTTAQRSEVPATGALRFNSTLKQFEGYDGTAWDAVSKPDSSLVSFQQDGTTFVRPVQDKMREVVSVKDFGAKGDGIANDTTAIQNALNTGKAVYVPSGTYNINALIYTTANGQRVFGDGILQTVIQNTTNNEPLFCFGNPRIASGATEFCTLEAITLHGKTDGTTLWGVYVPNDGDSTAGEYEGISPSVNNHYNGKTSFTRATWTGTARGCTLRDVRIRFVYGGYALHVSSWGFGAYNVQLWSGQRGLRNSGAANSNHFVDLYISSMGREAIIHPDVPNSIPTACGYINAVVQQCGLDDSSLGTCAFCKGQGTYVSGIYLERNNEKNATLATDVYVKVHEVGFVIDRVRHREEAGGTAPLQTIIRTEGAGARIGEVTFSSDVNEIVKVTGTSTDTSTFIFGPFSPVGTRTVTNGYINDTSTHKKTAVLLPQDSGWGFAISSNTRFYAAASKAALRNTRGTTNVLALESGGPMRFSSDVNNATSGGDFTWEHNGQDGAGSLLLTLQTSNGNLRPGADNTQALGSAGSRWSTIYAGTSTINTSDAREKQQVRSLSDAERAVAVRLKSLLRAFKFNDAVEHKGDGARIHFGFMAQDVKAAFEAEGLDPFAYALLCYDEWPEQQEERDEEGNIISPYQAAGNRYGVRYEELLAFMIATL